MKSRLRSVLITLALSVVGLIGILLFNALRVDAPAAPGKNAMTMLPVSADLLAEAVRIPTVMQDGKVDYAPFGRWRTFLTTRFPRVHRQLEVVSINKHSLLYTWKGLNPKLPAILLAGHYDVVPADSESNAAVWETAPFAGEIRDGYIWGRGAMDDKSGVIAMLLAIETLLTEGYQPASTIMLAIGHDEEVGGNDGAARIAAYLRERQIRPAWLLDEGMPITHGVMSVVTRPVAMIGIAEKGYLTLELASHGEGGHTSAPPAATAVDRLADALIAIQRHGLEPRLDGAVNAMFDRLLPHMGLLPRTLFANRWLFEPLLISQLAAKNSTNAMIRTTTAATMLEGSLKENVLPTRAWARINFRLLPGDRIDDVVERVKEITARSQVTVSIVGKPTEASSVSSVERAGFRTIEATLADVFPDAVAAPALFIAISDTRHYADLVDDIYRFRPIHVGPDDIKRFHGVNERLSVENFQQMVTFYYRLMQNATPNSAASTDHPAN